VLFYTGSRRKPTTAVVGGSQFLDVFGVDEAGNKFHTAT
jgi:hypothetical protein